MARHRRYFLPDQPPHVIQRGNQPGFVDALRAATMVGGRSAPQASSASSPTRTPPARHASAKRPTAQGACGQTAAA
jgi:hypothetical protein